MTPRDVIADAMMMAKGSDEHSLGDYDDANDLIAALAAAGYAIVPVEPTEEMLRAATENDGGYLSSPFLVLERMYRAMLKAAQVTP